MRIARVFPRRTSMTPNDEDAYVGLPPLGCPKYDEIHISATFTWDRLKADSLVENWWSYGKVILGGPAYSSTSTEFEPGRYLRKGITITSRGCPNACAWCFVPEREGKLRELPIQPGYIIQDNNLLACSKSHIRKVFEMLKVQRRAAVFSGGFEAARVTDNVIEDLRDLRINEVWLSYDFDGAESCVAKAIGKLRRFLPFDKVRCYVLIGQPNDTIEKAQRRLEWVAMRGALPFAMRYRTWGTFYERSFVHPEREWSLLARQWTRPAITKAILKAMTV